MTPKRTKREESQLEAWASGLEIQSEGAIDQIDSVRFLLGRREVVDGKFGPMSAFDLWLEDPSGDPPRIPDAHAFSSHAAAERLLTYADYVRLSQLEITPGERPTCQPTAPRSRFDRPLALGRKSLVSGRHSFLVPDAAVVIGSPLCRLAWMPQSG